LIRSFNQGYEKGYLSISQRKGVITCLPKEGKSKFYLKKDWRVKDTTHTVIYSRA